MKIINQFGRNVSNVKKFDVDNRDMAIISVNIKNGHDIPHAWYKGDNTSYNIVHTLNKLLSLNLDDNVIYKMPKGFGNELYSDKEMCDFYDEEEIGDKNGKL